MATKKKVKRRMRPGCLWSLIIILFSWIILFLTPIFNVQKITVTGNTRVDTQEVLLVSGVREDVNIFSLNLGRAKTKIRALPYVEDVKIKRELPHKIKIEIKEGTVAAYVEQGNSLVGINADGQTLCISDKASGASGAPYVLGIAIENPTVGEFVKTKDDDELEVVKKMLKTFDADGVLANITGIDVSDDDYIVFRHMDKLKVEFGSMNDYELKMDYFKGLLDEMGQDVAGVLNMIADNYTYRHTIE